MSHTTFSQISLDLGGISLVSSTANQSRKLIVIRIWDILPDSMTFSGIESGSCIRLTGADGVVAKKLLILNCAWKIVSNIVSILAR
jgi:hypothetical protein